MIFLVGTYRASVDWLHRQQWETGRPSNLDVVFITGLGDTDRMRAYRGPDNVLHVTHGIEARIVEVVKRWARWQGFRLFDELPLYGYVAELLAESPLAEAEHRHGPGGERSGPHVH